MRPTKWRSQRSWAGKSVSPRSPASWSRPYSACRHFSRRRRWTISSLPTSRHAPPHTNSFASCRQPASRRSPSIEWESFFVSEAIQLWSESSALVSEPLEAWMQRIMQRTERALDAQLPSPDSLPAKLHEAMRYATLGGGKRLRALLCHAAGELVDADPVILDGAACAIEMIHAYSLVHDDLPAMDNDLLRRGQPTVHVRYGEAMAILVGDGLQAQAFVVISELPAAPGQKVALLKELALAS